MIRELKNKAPSALRALMAAILAIGICIPATAAAPQAYAVDDFEAVQLDPTQLTDNVNYLVFGDLMDDELGYKHTKVDVTATSGGSVVKLQGAPKAWRNTTPKTGGNMNLPEGTTLSDWRGMAKTHCQIQPSWWRGERYNFPGKDMGDNSDASWPGDNNDAWAFVSSANSQGNGAAGASFTAVWRKAAYLKSTDKSDNKGRLVDIQMKTTFKTTVKKAYNDRAVFQFTNYFPAGFYAQGVAIWDQDITLLDSETKQPISLEGELIISQFSFDQGEGFSVKGASGSMVSKDAPKTNEHISTPEEGLPPTMLFSAIPGTQVYEINEGGYLGYIGVPSTSDAVLHAEMEREAKRYNLTSKWEDDSTINFVDKWYGSEKFWYLRDLEEKTNASSGRSLSSYEWRAAAITKDMSGQSTISTTNYSLGYIGWPGDPITQSADNNGTGTNEAVPAAVRAVGANTNNQANPSLDADSNSVNRASNYGSRYYSIRMGGLYGTQPGRPVKSVEDHQALKIGDTVKFTVDQVVNDFPSDISQPYTMFSFEDTMPDGLEIVDAKMSYIAPNSTREQAVPDSAGTMSLTDTSVNYTFKTSYLSADMETTLDPAVGMVYRGGTYRLTITAKVADLSGGPYSLETDNRAGLWNKAYTTINNVKKASNEVPVTEDGAFVDVVKSVEYEQAPGKEVEYTIKVANNTMRPLDERLKGVEDFGAVGAFWVSYSEADWPRSNNSVDIYGGVFGDQNEGHYVARNITVEDISLPAGAQIVEGSVTYNGIPAKVDVREVKNNKESIVTKDNNITVEASGTTFRATIPYLPSDTIGTFKFKVVFPADFNGQDIENTVEFDYDNPYEPWRDDIEPVPDADTVWLNSAELAIDKVVDGFEYRVGDVANYTVTLANTEPGTIAKNVVVNDSAMPERVKVDWSSVKVEGVPEFVEYPVDSHNYNFDEAYALAGREAPWGMQLLESEEHPGWYVLGGEWDAEGNLIDDSDLVLTKADLDTWTEAYEDENRRLVVPDRDFRMLELRNNAYTLEQDGNGFNLTIPYLPYGETVTITYSAECTLDSNGLETMNTATADWDNPLDPETPIKAEQRVWTNDAIFTIAKQVDKYEHEVGDTVHYTATFQNIAAGTVAKNVVMDDLTLPDGLVLDASSIEVSGVPESVVYPIDGEGGEHAEEVRDNAYKVNMFGNGFKLLIDYLPAAAPVTVTFDAVATEDVNGDEVINTVRVTADNTYEGGKVWEDDAKIWVNTPHLTIDKKPVEERTVYKQGETVTYRIQVDNAQVGTVAYDVEIEDAFKQEGMQLIRSSIIVFDADGNILSNAKVKQNMNTADFQIATNNDLVCDDGNYQIWEDKAESTTEQWNPLGQTSQTRLFVEYQAVVTAEELTATDVVNVAKAKATNADEVEDEAIIKVKGEDPNIEVVKFSKPENGSKVAPGEEIAYFVNVTNNGKYAVSNVAVYDAIPEHTTFASAPEAHGATYNVESNGIGWLIASIEPGATATCEFTVTVDAGTPAGTEIRNVATYEPDSPEVPKGPLPEETNEVKHPVGDKLNVVKSSNPKPGTLVKAGDEIEYTISVTNEAASAAKDVAVYDAIPDNTEFVSVGEGHGGKLASDKKGVGWNIAELAAGETAKLTFKVKVASDVKAGTEIRNVATYAPDTPGIPEKPLPGKTNEVKHPTPGDTPPSSTATPSGKAYGKTGVNIPALVSLIALLAVVGTTAGIYAGRTGRKAESDANGEPEASSAEEV